MPNKVLEYGCSHDIKWLPNHKLTSSASHSTETHIYCIRVIKCRIRFRWAALSCLVWYHSTHVWVEEANQTCIAPCLPSKAGVRISCSVWINNSGPSSHPQWQWGVYGTLLCCCHCCPLCCSSSIPICTFIPFKDTRARFLHDCPSVKTPDF